ncbi:MAG: hypothetical protein JO322_01195 [Candidatus Eremiobacteraeota bacterium]|nr:hypothetical protein [Candidatus Eremiobacteraeota bacterium]
MIRSASILVSLVAAVAAWIIATPASAQEASPSPSEAPSPSPASSPAGIQLRLTPYLWAPTINGSFNFHHPSLPPGSTAITSVGVQVGPNSYLSKLNSAIELTVELNDPHSVAFGDLIYLNAANTTATVFDLRGPLGHVSFPLNVSTSARITTTLATIGLGGVVLGTGRNAAANVFAGLRYIDVNANASWNLAGPLGNFSRTGNASESSNNLAGIIGSRARIGLGTSWYVPLYADYGGNGDLTTYQWAAGIAHSYHSGAQILLWRQLAYIGNPGNTSFISTLHMGGPAFAWSFYL